MMIKKDNKSNYRYGLEKILKGLRRIVTYPGNPKEKILDAYIYELRLIKEKNLPPHLWEKFLILEERLSRKKARYFRGKKTVGSAKESLRGTRNTTAAKLAEIVFDLYFELDSFIN